LIEQENAGYPLSFTFSLKISLSPFIFSGELRQSAENLSRIRTVFPNPCQPARFGKLVFGKKFTSQLVRFLFAFHCQIQILSARAYSTWLLGQQPPVCMYFSCIFIDRPGDGQKECRSKAHLLLKCSGVEPVVLFFRPHLICILFRLFSLAFPPLKPPHKKGSSSGPN